MIARPCHTRRSGRNACRSSRTSVRFSTPLARRELPAFTTTSTSSPIGRSPSTTWIMDIGWLLVGRCRRHTRYVVPPSVRRRGRSISVSAAMVAGAAPARCSRTTWSEIVSSGSVCFRPALTARRSPRMVARSICRRASGRTTTSGGSLTRGPGLYAAKSTPGQARTTPSSRPTAGGCTSGRATRSTSMSSRPEPTA